MQIKIDELVIEVEKRHKRSGYGARLQKHGLLGLGETPISACADLLDKYDDYLQTRLIAHFNR